MRGFWNAVIGVLLYMGISPCALAQETEWSTLNARVEKLFGKGQYDEAFPIAQKALKVANETFGPAHPNVAITTWGHFISQGCQRNVWLAISLNNLGALYFSQKIYRCRKPPQASIGNLGKSTWFGPSPGGQIS